MSATPLADAWRINCRHTLFLLDSLSADQLAHRHTPRSKTVAAQFRHLAVIRKACLDVCAPKVVAAISLPPAESDTVSEIRAALVSTGETLADAIAAAETTGKLKGYASTTNFLAYACAHEGHHRGQVLLYLKIGGKAFDSVKSYKLWAWK